MIPAGTGTFLKSGRNSGTSLVTNYLEAINHQSNFQKCFFSMSVKLVSEEKDHR